jgi:hypothetical protein
MKHGNRYCHLHGKCRKCIHPQCSNYVQSHGVCIEHGYKRKKCSKQGCTNNAVMNGVCINHGSNRYCTILECGKPLFQAWKCRFHFRCLLAASTIDSMTENVLAAANAMVGMRYEATSTTSGSVVGGQKFHFIDHDAIIMDNTNLTLKVIQQTCGDE